MTGRRGARPGASATQRALLALAVGAVVVGSCVLAGAPFVLMAACFAADILAIGLIVLGALHFSA